MVDSVAFESALYFHNSLKMVDSSSFSGIKKIQSLAQN